MELQIQRIACWDFDARASQRVFLTSRSRTECAEAQCKSNARTKPTRQRLNRASTKDCMQVIELDRSFAISCKERYRPGDGCYELMLASSGKFHATTCMTFMSFRFWLDTDIKVC